MIAVLPPPRVLALPLVVVLTPRVLVQVLAASLSKRPRAALVVVLMPRERAQPLAVASTRALVLLPGPYLSALLARGTGARIYCMTRDRLQANSRAVLLLPRAAKNAKRACNRELAGM